VQTARKKHRARQGIEQPDPLASTAACDDDQADKSGGVLHVQVGQVIQDALHSLTGVYNVYTYQRTKAAGSNTPRVRLRVSDIPAFPELLVYQ
jgi:hypothetical protein